LEFYPPSLNQVALLAESGLRVAVVDLEDTRGPPAYFGLDTDVVRIRAGKHLDSYSQQRLGVLERGWNALLFVRRARSMIRRLEPRVVIAYDPYAMAAVGAAWRRLSAPRLVWHFHELFEARSGRARSFADYAVKFSAKFVGNVDAVIFPDANRAAHFRQSTGVSFEPLIVMNCPRRVAEVPPSNLRKKLAEQRFAATDLVYFQGVIGSSRCFEPIIRSIPHWPRTAGLVLVGPVSEGYRGELLQLAAELGVAERIHFLDRVPYQELSTLTAGATLGLSLVEHPTDMNWKLSAGAVNKRFEYMAVGVPQIANVGPGMSEIVEKPGCGVLVEPNDATAIGKTINSLLSSPGQLDAMRSSARRAHIERFCYEVQFQPALGKIRRWCNEQARSPRGTTMRCTSVSDG
jgi:glycosyltransferase involved in cell wall biosynthesis